MSDQSKNKSEQNQNSPIPDLPAKQMKVESETKKSNEHHSAEGQKTVRNDMDSHEDSFIGQYKVVKTIGKGNFAKVKLAQHVITKRNVAIKIMDKTKMNPSGLHKLMREVRIMKMLDHPNIVKLYEVMESETMLYIVIEYCEGGEVFDYLVSHGRMKEKEARDKFRQILSAVQYCHRLFVIHRDLKAENLLLDSHLNIKIADFGFSNQYHPEKKLETFCGSPPYAAPELFLGQKYIGPEVDIWSLGVILFTLVSGSLPFDGQNIKELRAKVLKGVFRIPFFMSTTCECLIRRMLVIDTNKRIKLDEVMEDEWVNDGMPPLKPYQSPPPCYDEKRIQTLLSMGFTSEEITRSLRDKRYDPVMATYMLLDTTTCGPDDYMKYRCEPTQVSNMDTRIRSSFYDRHDIKPDRHSPCTPTRDQYSSSYTKPRQRPTTVADALSSHRARQSQIPHSRRYTFFVEPTYNKGENMEKEAIKRHSIPTGIKNNAQSDREQQGFTKEGNRLDVYNLISSPKKIGYLSESPSQDSPKVRKGFIERLSDRLRRSSFSSKTPPPNAEEFIDIPFNSSNRPAITYNPNDYPRQNCNEQSDSVEDPSTPIINQSIHQLPEPRSLRFTWNFRTTSSKSPADILLEINRVLLMYRIEFQQIDSFTFQCFYDFSKSQGTSSDQRRLSLEYPSFKNSSPVTPPKSLVEGGGGSNHGTEEIVPRKNNLSYVVNRSVQWEVEVCKLPLLFMNAVRFKRISGETFLYKIIVSQITDELKL